MAGLLRLVDDTNPRSTNSLAIRRPTSADFAQGLSGLLADSHTLYLTTHNFHWNVTGPMFNTLHIMFMGQYTEQWNALDLRRSQVKPRSGGRN